MYPAPFTPEGGDHATLSLDTGRPDREIVQSKGSGVVLAFDAEGLRDLATRAGCVVELVPQVGDFLAVGEPLFRLYGPGAAAVDESALRDSVALGIERTMEQDPAFGFRIIVDIASKALDRRSTTLRPASSPSTSSTTCSRWVSRRQLDTGVLRDASGECRFVHRTPDWEDFVTLAGTELRIYGATNPQVTRRLRAMYDQLLRVVPPERAEALRRERTLLEETISGTWSSPRDREIAGAPDSQGFGGRARRA